MTNSLTYAPLRSSGLTNKQIEKVYEVFIDSFAGAAGGVMSQVLFYPLGNLQTRLQAGPGHQGSKIDLSKQKPNQPGNLQESPKTQKKENMIPGSPAPRVYSPKSDPKKVSIVQVIRRMIQKDGLLSFYKGFYMAL